MRSRIRPDRQLTVRMGATMFLLGLLYVAFAAALVVLLRSVVLIVVIVAGLMVAQYWFSDRIALAALRGRVVTPEQEPRLHAVVDRLCALADLPKPRVAVAELDLPNAFATGRNAEHAVVCVTRRTLDLLDDRELEGVLAHELAHVAHRDVAVITVASFLGVVAGLLMRTTVFSQAFGRRRDQGTAAVLAAVTLVSALVYAISFLLIRALSRYRELAADRDGALLTANPSALASALMKITGDTARIPRRDLREVQAFNAFFIAPVGGRLAALFATHPALDVRLERLADLAVQIGGTTENPEGGR
ncbi:zinc metalloprotease HtpX [Catenulispora subtropica]|uniref:Protease HtpX homolog n=1 Tax=Catenulispora subtropica TaxID=450798 RepID=A0ABN2TBZ5_9ACTN